MCLYEAQISGERLQDHWLSGFINSIIQSIVAFAASFPQLNDFVTVFPFKSIGDPI